MNIVEVGWIVELSLRPLAAAALVAIVLFVLRVRASAVRHAAWSAVLAAMVLMPALQVVVPPLEVRFPVPTPHVPTMVALEEFTATLPPTGAAAATTSGTFTSGPAMLTPSRSPAPSRIAPASAGTGTAWLRLLLTLYAVVSVAMLTHLAIGWFAARRLAQRSQPIDTGTSVFESAQIATPLTVGIGRPRILLPKAWRAWPAETLTAVLAHERAHVARRDLLVAVVARVNRALFWFHPLAWWLERQLAVTAEYAADDRAVRELGGHQRYAEVLVDIAAAAAARGGRRVVWQGVGMDGTSRLSERIDRILRTDVDRRLSRSRTLLVSIGCLGAILVAVACQQSRATPLTPDPQVTEALARSKASTDLNRAAWAMTPQQAADLQAAWEKTPDDLEAAKQLLLYYQPVHEGKWMPEAPSWIEPRRKIVLWLVEHHPESALNQLTRLVPPGALRDNEGFAQAKARWTAALSHPDADGHVLANAAHFFRDTDPQQAERILLRARTSDPDGGRWVEDGAGYASTWTAQLADLYAAALTGSANEPGVLGYPFGPPGPFGQEVRRKLELSTDAALLTSTATALTRFTLRTLRANPVGFDPEALARDYLTRALSLSPDLPSAREALFGLDSTTRSKRIRALTQSGPTLPQRTQQEQYDALATLSDSDRFVQLPAVAESTYMQGEYLDYSADHPQGPLIGDKAKAKELWALSVKAANAALALAPKFKDTDDYGMVAWRANLALGVVAMRAGDGRLALKHLAAAADAPPSDGIRYGAFTALEYRLTDTFLQYGERESVARYYERMAPKQVIRKDASLKAAAAIRAGRMPEDYQRRHTPRP